MAISLSEIGTCTLEQRRKIHREEQLLTKPLMDALKKRWNMSDNDLVNKFLDSPLSRSDDA